MEEVSIKERLFEWLMETEEQAAAELVNECDLRFIYVDTEFAMEGEREFDFYDAQFQMPAKYYKNRDKYKNLIKKIEDAIREISITDDIYVKGIAWIQGRTRFRDEVFEKKSKKLEEIIDKDYVKKQFKLMTENIEGNPHLTIGIAKEFIETVCKTILSEKGIEIDKDWDVGRILKETNKSIKILLDDFENKQNAEKSIHKLLGGLSSIVQAITELRNNFGSGHGHKSDFKGLNSVYANLVANLSYELSLFYLHLHGKENM